MLYMLQLACTYPTVNVSEYRAGSCSVTDVQEGHIQRHISLLDIEDSQNRREGKLCIDEQSQTFLCPAVTLLIHHKTQKKMIYGSNAL
jgi:hypothetical protein